MMLRRVVVGALLAASACTQAEPPEASPVFTPDAPPAAPSALLYLDGTTLKSFDLQTRDSATITRLPSADVAVSPDGKRLVAVQETHPVGPGPEGFRRPELVIASTSAREIPSALGPGRSPMWNASSSAIAAIAPAADGETIVVHNLPGGIVDTSAPHDAWSLVGWSGDDVVAIGARSGVTRVPVDGSETAGLRVAPEEMWGVAPVGDTYLAVTDSGGTLVGSDGRRRVNVSERVLGDGAWSWDGATVAATLVARPRTQLVLVDAATGHVRQVAAGPGVQGNVVWAIDNKTFAFVRVDPDDRTRLQAVICTSRIDCGPAFSWGQGVRLLAFR